MIRASISTLHETIFRPYIFGLMKRHFHSIRLLGDAPDVNESAVLLLPNHSTWWDGFFVYLLKEAVFRQPVYLMMLEEQLRRNRFFSRIGAYSINPGSVKGSLESLFYTQELLAKKAVVCLFPQGELLPWEVRPLVYKRGVERIIRQSAESVRVVQAAFKAEYLSAQRADVFIRLQEVTGILDTKKDLIALLQDQHATLLDELQNCILLGAEGKILLRGKSSVNESFELFRRSLSRRNETV